MRPEKLLLRFEGLVSHAVRQVASPLLPTPGFWRRLENDRPSTFLAIGFIWVDGFEIDDFSALP
jgi:hypothetical protein